MSFVPTQCPSCLKSIQVPIDIQISKCMYCGADVSTPSIPTAAPSVSLTNLLGMARTASAAGNLTEAESYYNRVLELDPRNSEAWIGKGKAAAWQSSIVNIRTTEMTVSFNHAIATSTETSRASAIETCTHEMNHLVTTLYGMAKTQLHEFVALYSTWTSYIAQVAQLLDGLDSALAWDPNNQTTLENIVHLCKDNIEGITYRDPYDNNQPKGWTLSPAYEQILRNRLDNASEKLKSINPSYAAPVIEKKKPDACFVVTATMGNENHPNVILLRQFRSEILSGTHIGEFFIRWYYKNGPGLAKVVKHSNFHRAISYFLVVTPAALAALILLPLHRKLIKREKGDKPS